MLEISRDENMAQNSSFEMEFRNSSPFNRTRNTSEESVVFAECLIYSFKKIYIGNILFFPDIVALYVLICQLWADMNIYTQVSEILSFVSLRLM